MTGAVSNNPTTGIAALIASQNNAASEKTETNTLFGEDGFSFGDILDIVNPLQHIPIVNSIYRKITGDTIAPVMQVAGGALFGGPLGAAISLVTTAFQSHFNNDTKSSDPDSPYIDKNNTAINPETIAGNVSPHSIKAISNNDYAQNNNTAIQQAAYSKQPENRSVNYGGSIGALISAKSKTVTSNNELYAKNILPKKQMHQTSSGIINPAHSNTNVYKDVTSSTNAPTRNIDIIIGSTFGSG